MTGALDKLVWTVDKWSTYPQVNADFVFYEKVIHIIHRLSNPVYRFGKRTQVFEKSMKKWFIPRMGHALLTNPIRKYRCN